MSRESVVVELVRAVAAVEGVEPHELDYSLYDYVDTEAIRSLAAFDRENWSLTFEIPDHEVTLTGTGEIRVDGEVRRQLDAVEFERLD
ncbi:HalOD1 output domain-containing protein [Halorientalis pallida]|uniref:HalOD1 output domain-containing protein n=1 Tax=Halorientalis pallida TaxID=2479928 RepID=UPI003C6FCB29